ncbi:MAG: hypothetical protein Q7T82_04485 [Armatimonadota bacterium]|nr:hypothetical protein [Armatimonadota bacterium]
MRQQPSIREKLCEDLEDLPEEQLSEVVQYVERLREETLRQRRAGQGLDARGLELIWRCTECGYVQAKREALPEACPSCGAPKQSFVLVEED